MPRSVLILVENLPSPFDRRVWQEATTLRDAGYAVSIVCPTGKGHEQTETIDGIAIWRYRLPFEASRPLGYVVEYAVALVSALVLSWRIARRRGVDIVHTCNPPDLFFLIGALFKFFGARFVFDHHDLNPELYVAKFGRRGIVHRVLVALERASFRLADVSIAANESYRQIAIERGGMAPERVHVVRSGPSLERMRFLPPDPRLKNGRRYLVGYVGVLGRQEGVDYLLTAAWHIVVGRGRTDVQFGIVGDGTMLAPMKALAQELEIADYVTFTGHVPDDEVPAMLSAADVCVNSDAANGLNDMSTMKVMEYMALGKPIVQFDSTEGRFSAGPASLYAAKNNPVDFADKILELLDDPDLRAEMGAIGRRRIETELEWRHEAPKLLAAYATLAQPALGTVRRTGHPRRADVRAARP